MPFFSAEDEEYEFQFYEPVTDRRQASDTEESTIECSNCGRELLDVCVTGPMDIPSNIKFLDVDAVKNTVIVNCPFCGDQSFIVEINGQFRMAPQPGVGIEDVEYSFEENDNCILSRIKTISTE